MDPEVWKHLADHEEILRLVLARLSWDTNRGLRSVCKAWYDILSEPSFLTWASMLTDRSFYSDHGHLEWVDSSTTPTDNSKADSSTSEHHPKRTVANPVCLLSTSQNTCALANFELRRWCKLPRLLQLPVRNWVESQFAVSGAAKGLLLMEKNIRDMSEDLYELDRYLLNPLAYNYVKLPPVPKVQYGCGRTLNRLRYPMILTVDRDKCVKVVATEFTHHGGAGLAGTKLTRILIWTQDASSWEEIETDAIAECAIPTLDQAVFAGGELFLHTRYLENGMKVHRIIKCERHAVNFEVSMDLFTQFADTPILHLFQHRGVLMCCRGTWKVGHEHSLRYRNRYIQHIKLCSFDHVNGSWLQDSMIDMPKQMVKGLYDTLPDGGVWRFYVDVEGDTLCIGNRQKADVFFLYDLISHEWSACNAKEFKGQNHNSQEIFLWSPRQVSDRPIQS